MTFNAFWVDFWLKDKLFGLGFLSVEKEELYRSLFAAYWNDGELIIDLFWFRVYIGFPFFYWWFYKEANSND